MLEIGIGIAVFAVAIAGLSLGVIFKKRTPLKGSCHSAAAAFDEGSEGGRCSSCSCGAPTESGLRP